ncbi:hypothetical protein PHPALM_30608 [Phytophthora palmivora]|uniref:Reverse transcriptase RNase H-like domain-containing protein n=1 Tax=Phytophthora palmivora TaxID=4796 RepID=A0A2P4X4Q1_9STRA|nr:hypothetical protein PHPALM_30608 [Phytophthora palmivora]
MLVHRDPANNSALANGKIGIQPFRFMNSNSALNWGVIEKECYSIVRSCEKLEYLLLRPQGFRLYCDHRYIIFLFSPNKELKPHVREKLLQSY